MSLLAGAGRRSCRSHITLFNHGLPTAPAEVRRPRCSVRSRSASARRAARIRICSSGLIARSPSSNVQILNRLTPDILASLLCEIPSACLWDRKFITATVVARLRMNKDYLKTLLSKIGRTCSAAC
jgi:hypothetical protein